jgi:AcrR family transcriptional regulator
MANSPTAAQRRIYQAAMKLFAERGVTQVSVSDLAEYADVARGTIYNNIDSLETLFEDVAGNLASEMNQRVVTRFSTTTDPAQRLAFGIRMYVRRAHEEPSWGLFITSFAFSHAALRELWSGHPAIDIMNGVQNGRYDISIEQVPSALGLLGSSVISAMYLVREGLKTWREAGSDAAELVLKGLGVPKDEAHRLATEEMPTE